MPSLNDIRPEKTKRPVDPQTVKSVEIVEVIKTVSYRGNGVDTVFREVVQYWGKDGQLLAENDPFKER